MILTLEIMSQCYDYPIVAIVPIFPSPSLSSLSFEDRRDTRGSIVGRRNVVAEDPSSFFSPSFFL